MTVDVKLACSADLKDSIEWKCKQGINVKTMVMLNEEFNYYRGLFPLKVFIGGPPCSGKTHFAAKLNEMYGIPHIKTSDIIAMGKSLTSGYGEVIKQKIEELRDHAEAEYEKNRKKKDPDFDRASYNPRLPDECLMELVKIMLSSAGCMNKGFILEGFPRSKSDAAGLFMEKVHKADGQEGEFEEKVNQKLVPQYAIILEGDDASLQQKAKELPAEKVEGTHWNDAGMVRRLKEFRARNPDDDNTRDFLTKLIGHENVL